MPHLHLSKTPRFEFVLCLALIGLSILTWLGFLAFLQSTFAERAAFAFMASHLRLGESPDFALQIAGDGIPQPWHILFVRPEFWVSLALLVLFAGALGFLAFRLRALDKHPSP